MGLEIILQLMKPQLVNLSKSLYAQNQSITITAKTEDEMEILIYNMKEKKVEKKLTFDEFLKIIQG